MSRWTVLDFALIWFAGLVGAALVGVASGAATMAFGFPDDVALLVIIGLFGQYLATLLVLSRVARRREDLGLSIETKDLLYVGLGMFLQVVVALLIAPISEHFFPDGRPPQDIADIFTSPDTTFYFKMALFFTAVVVAPVVEEILFRGILLKALLRRGKVLAITVSSLLFAAVHIPGLLQEDLVPAMIVVLPPLFGLGVLLSLITIRTGRLGPAIFLHSGWNLLAAVVLLIPAEVLEQLG